MSGPARESAFWRKARSGGKCGECVRCHKSLAKLIKCRLTASIQHGGKSTRIQRQILDERLLLKFQLLKNRMTSWHITERVMKLDHKPSCPQQQITVILQKFLLGTFDIAFDQIDPRGTLNIA